VKGYYTDWTPLTGRENSFFPEDVDTSDPWQFKNILMRESGVKSAETKGAANVNASKKAAS
jgi:hypothetical protein